MAYDPNVLRTLVSPPPTYPGSPANPVNPMGHGGQQGPAPAGDAPKAEPVALHEAGITAQKAIKAAREALEDLSAQAEMGETIDPSVEKTISAAADSIAELDETMDEITEKLGDARQDHEDMVTPDADHDGM